jgi:hypothetical protein
MSCLTVNIERVTQPMEVVIGLVCSVPTTVSDFSDDFNNDFNI